LENSIAYLYTLEGQVQSPRVFPHVLVVGALTILSFVQSPSVADNPIPDVVKQYAEHLRSLSRDKPLMCDWICFVAGFLLISAGFSFTAGLI
jgi:hypothetical protein